MTIKPATPLPWLVNDFDPLKVTMCDDNGDQDVCRMTTRRTKDAAYILHAANSYPKLVEALRQVAGGKPYAKRAADILRELGEAE